MVLTFIKNIQISSHKVLDISYRISYIKIVKRERFVMIEMLENYIAACEANIVRYKAMGDEKAVKAAEGMIRDFQKEITNFKVV